MSINELRKRKTELFDKNDWFGSEPFAKHSATCWRQVTLTAVELGETYQEQMKSLPPDVDLTMARELVVYLIVLGALDGQPPRGTPDAMPGLAHLRAVSERVLGFAPPPDRSPSPDAARSLAAGADLFHRLRHALAEPAGV